MKKILLAVTSLSIAMPALPVLAQVNPAPTIAPAPTPEEFKLPRPPRERGIPTALAIEAAVAANASCQASTYKTTTLVTDSAGVPIVVNTDAHRTTTLDLLPYGVATARRGWATAADVINTRPLDAILERRNR